MATNEQNLESEVRIVNPLVTSEVAAEDTASERELASYSKALSHPTRVRILNLLRERKDCIVNDIVDELPVVQSTVSQHIKVLKDAGLITGKSRGPRTLYSVDMERVKRLKTLIETL